MGNAAAHRESDGEPKPTLYVVATPIGNLRDVSLRALDVLKSVDTVAAEDTRITARLLNHYGIAKQLIALHEHNEKRMVPQVLALLAAGRSVALVSDAGTPAISDPGAQLVAAAIAAGYRVTPVPGANAAVTALSAAGLATPRFLFYGFLPARAAERKRELAELRNLPYALVFFEAPHRVVDSIADLHAAFGDARRIVIARELTKMFETMHACALAEATGWIEANADRRKGEFVLILDGRPVTRDGEEQVQAQRVLEVLLAELPLRQAVVLATKITGGKRNELYDLALRLKGEP
ncbi:MAG: 16S rRNA (cytidine(1402)-2'-O)-methyltransferase [Burkholderiales bacterium]|nr:16S rRNA (cytidine(1402)-2'-O)-methyltransferase [Burkholderiales bacterium]